MFASTLVGSLDTVSRGAPSPKIRPAGRAELAVSCGAARTTRLFISGVACGCKMPVIFVHDANAEAGIVGIAPDKISGDR